MDEQQSSDFQQTQGQPTYFGEPVVAPDPEYLLLQWMADSRVAVKRSREYYSSLLVIILLVSLILFFMNYLLLIVVIWSFLFVVYALSSTKPEQVIHQITTYGIRYRGKLYYWNQLGRFWTKESHGHIQIMIECPATLGGTIILLPEGALDSPEVVTAQDIAELLSRYLVYEEPLPSQVDKWVQWLEEKFPLESPQRSK